MPISSLGGFGGQAGRDDRPVAKGDGRRVRSGLAAGGKWIRTFGPPATVSPVVALVARLAARDRGAERTLRFSPLPSRGIARSAGKEQRVL